MTKEALRQYLVAITVTAIISGGISYYLFVRNGTFIPSIANKGLADGSLALLGIVLLVGPLSRLYNRFDKWVNYRKELGILAFIIGAVHVYLSMFVLARRGPFGLYQSRPLVAYTGLLGLVIMAYLFIISFEKIKEKIGMAKWWKMQYWGARITGVAIFVHMTAFKYPEWNTWLSGKTEGLALPNLPPANLLVAIFFAFVLLTRLSERLNSKVARFLTPVWLGTAAITSFLLFKL
jgi:DMSO/TMAO reductase YedYZ heme-binding membrane subunit